jgi:hypothetical protein
MNFNGALAAREIEGAARIAAAPAMSARRRIIGRSFQILLIGPVISTLWAGL